MDPFRNFNYLSYINMNKDLKHLNRKQALIHFKKFGIIEKRKFNRILENFDYTFYISFYKDLNKLDFLQACNHYIEHGRREGREAKAGNLYNNNKLLCESENFNSINYLLKNTWIWESDKKLPIKMTVALPALNAKKIIWLALESLKNQINVDFGWELIVFEENGISKDIVQSYKGLLPNCVKIIYKTLYPIDAYYDNNILKSNNFPTYYTLLEKWINIAKIADKNSKIFVKHAVDCYSPPNRLNIHYQHFKNKDCYYSTQSKGYFYNIKDDKYFLYNGIQIEPYNWKRYAKQHNYNLQDRSINKSFSFRSCHLNMALRIDNIINLKLPNNPIKSGIDGYIIFSLFRSLNLHPEDKKIIWNDSEVDQNNWYKSLDTDGYNNISLKRKKYYDMKIPKSPHCIPTHKSNVKLDIPEYIMERLKNL